MIELLPSAHWTWWGFGALLVVLEVVVSGTFLLWMGISAGVIGVIVYFSQTYFGQNVAWEIQFTLFAVFSLASIFLSRKYLQSTADEQSTLSARGKGYIGMVVIVEESIVNGVGKVRVEDTVWRVQGDHIADGEVAAGERVRITDIKGATFEVEKIL